MESIDGFQIVRELGRGGMGVVYEARHPTLNRSVALKVILEDSANADAVARFAREAELLARLRHPNVVRVHKLGRAEQGPYLVTELLEGQELGDLAAQGLDPKRAARILRDLASGVAALHSKGVVHRDLKPDNVFVRPDGSPVLLDFGVARGVGAEKLTQTGVVVGTPAYMPPEQAGEGSTRTLDERSDVYGLGAILFFLLARRMPFDGTSVVAVLKRVLTEEPRWPSADAPDTPRDLEAICRKAMAKEPPARYPTARAFGADLDRYLNGEAVHAASPSRAPRIALAALGLLLVVGVAGALASAGDARPLDGIAPTTTESKPPALPSRAEREAARKRRIASTRLDVALRGHDPRATLADVVAWLEENPDHPRAEAAQAKAAELRSRLPMFSLSHPGRTHAAFASARRLLTWTLAKDLIRYWNLETGDQLWEARIRKNIFALAIERGDASSRAILGSLDGVFLLDLGERAAGSLTRFEPFGVKPARTVTLSPDGRALAVLSGVFADAGEFSIFSWPDGALRHSFSAEGGFPGEIELAISADGALFVAGGGHQPPERNYKETTDPGVGRIVTWSLEADREINDMRKPRARPTALCFVGRTHTLLVGDVAGNVYTLDPTTAQDAEDSSPVWLGTIDERLRDEHLRPRSHGSQVVSGVACTPDGKTAFSVGKKDNAFGQLRAWDVSSREELRFIINDDESEFSGCELAPDSRLLAVGNTTRGAADGRVLIFSSEVR